MSFATMATLALGGAALGAIANPEDREKGALMGLGAGLLAPVAAPGLLAAPAAAPVVAPVVTGGGTAASLLAPVAAGAGTLAAGRYSSSWWRYQQLQVEQQEQALEVQQEQVFQEFPEQQEAQVQLQFPVYLEQQQPPESQGQLEYPAQAALALQTQPLLLHLNQVL